MDKKRGFTLIELLAVIVILAILLVLVVPKVVDTIEDVRKSAFRDSADLMAKDAQYVYQQDVMRNEKIQFITYTFKDNQYTSSNRLNFKGEYPDNGVIKINDEGKVALAIVSKNKKYCATKNYTDKISTVIDANTECKIDNEIKATIEEGNLIRYTVTFNDDGRKTKQKVAYKKTVEKIQPSGKDNYKFLHWSLSENGSEFNFETKITSDITLYAVYERIVYTISFIDEGNISQVSVNSGDTIEPKEADGKTGYNFLHWSLSENGSEYNFKTKVTKNITLYAVYNINSYTASFDGNGGSNGNDITKNYNSELGTLPTTSRTGYTFKGWYTSKTGGNQISTTTKLTKNVTYYAQWTINKVYIKIHVNSGSLSSSHGSAISTSGSYITVNNSTIVHTIDYGDKIGTDGLVNYNNSGYINIERTGYIAKSNQEWNTKTDGSGTSYDQTTNYSASDFCNASTSDCTVTLYVNWKLNSFSCTAGNYLDGKTCKQCTQGYSCPGGTFTYNGGIQGRTKCSAGSFSKAGASSCTKCANGSYSTSAGSTSCTACAGGKTNSGTGNTSCSSNCTNSTAVTSWKTPSWTNNSTSNLCAANSCNTGHYVSGKNCTAYTLTISFNCTIGCGWTASSCSSSKGFTYSNGTCSKTVKYGEAFGTLPTPQVNVSQYGFTLFHGWFFAGSGYCSNPWNYYADTYADLKAAFGYDATSLKNHYNNHGKSEGRRISQYISTDINTISVSSSTSREWCAGYSK